MPPMLSTIDTLQYSEEFQQAKFTKTQSKILALKIKESQETSLENIATKDDIRVLRSEIKYNSSEIDSLKSEVKRLDNKIDNLEEKMEARFDAVDARFEVIDHKFDSIDYKFKSIDHKFEALDHKIDSAINKAVIKMIILMPAIMTTINYFLKIS